MGTTGKRNQNWPSGFPRATLNRKKVNHPSFARGFGGQDGHAGIAHGEGSRLDILDILDILHFSISTSYLEHC